MDPFGKRAENSFPPCAGWPSGTVEPNRRESARRLGSWTRPTSPSGSCVNALSRLRAPGVRGWQRWHVLSALQWAYIDSGRWDETLTTAPETADTAAAYQMETVAASADLATATVLALRGDQDRVQPLLRQRALAVLDASSRPRDRRAEPGTPPASPRWPAAATRPPTPSSASSSAPTARRCTTTSPTWPSPTLPPAALRAERRLEARAAAWNARWPK